MSTQRMTLGAVQIAYRQAGQGPSLVFVHGLGGGAAAWTPQIEAFSRSYRVIAWDGPGYGGSEDLAMETPSLGDYVAVLARFLDAVGVHAVHLVGHSFGGLIIAAFNRRFPHRVLSLTFLQAVTGSGKLDVQRQRQLCEERRLKVESMPPEEFARYRAQKALAAGAPPALVAHAAKVSYSVRPRGYLQAYRAMCSGDIFSELEGISAPALVVAADQDRTATPAMCRSIARAIPGATFHLVAGAGHVVYLEAAEELNAKLAEFLIRVG